VGLKLTNGPWGVAALVALLVVAPRLDRLRALLIAALGMGVGFVVSYGSWAFVMWGNYDSPFFPLFNTVFRSPDYIDVNFRGNPYLVDSALDLAVLPFRWMSTSRETSEAAMRDWRWALLIIGTGVVLLAWAFSRLWARRDVLPVDRGPPHAIVAGRTRRFLLVMLIVGLFVSLIQLAYTRYLVFGELVCGLGLLALADVAVQTLRLKLVVVSTTALLLVATSTTGSWGTVDFASTWFRVSRGDGPTNALVLVADYDPVGYAVPILDPSNRYALVGAADEHFPRRYQEWRPIIEGFPGEVYLLTSITPPTGYSQAVAEDLARYHLALEGAACRPMPGVGALWLCPLRRS
jgi:hypothetical protein